MAKGSESIEKEDVLIQSQKRDELSQNVSNSENFQTNPEQLPAKEVQSEAVYETLENEQIQKQEQKKEPVEDEGPSIASVGDASGVSVTPPIQKTYSETYLALKSILDENLEAYLVNLPEEKLQAVYMEQEKVLQKLEKMVNSFVIKTREVLDLIRKWLKFIPGLNNFFLIQDAKIKTERVIELSQKKQKEQLPS